MGPFRIIEVDVAEAEAGAPAPRHVLRPGDGGLAAVIRDGAAIVGFEMRARADLPAGGVVAADLVGAEARDAALAERLRRLGPPLDDARAPRISVAVCTKDRPAWVSRLLSSLLPLRAEVPFEVLVVDNAPSDDATRRIVEASPGVRYLREGLVGLDFARNRAVREATGDVLAFLDDDVTVDGGWARGLAQAWAANPDAGAVTGLVLPMALDTQAQVLFELRGGFRRGFLPLRWGATAFRDPLHPCGAGKFGAGANMSVDLALVRHLGGFDEALDTGRPLPGGGDLDIFYRILRAGRTLVYEPRAAVFHDHRGEMAALHRQYYTWGLGLSAFLAKSMRADPSMRRALRRTAWWWFGYQASRVADSLRGREPTPLRMIAAEAYGGVWGLLGEYRRSERRSAAIRARSA